MWAIDPAAAASPETAMFAPAAAAGFPAAARKTGRRMFPSTSPRRPPTSATMKHQAPTAARTSACTRLNMAYDRKNAPRQRVAPPGSGRGAPGTEGPANRSRHGDGRRYRTRPAPCRRLRQRPRLSEEARRDDAWARGGTRGAAVAAGARAADEADPAADLRVRSVRRARRADEPIDRRARTRG